MKYKKLIIALSIVAILIITYYATSSYRHGFAQKYEKSGDQLSSQNNYSKAVLEYRKAHLIFLGDSEICFKAAQTYEILNNSKAAYSYYNKAIDIEPTSVKYYLALANSYWSQDDTSNAIFTLRKGLDEITNKNDEKELNILLGQIYLDRNEKEKALRAFEDADSDLWQGIYYAWLENYDKANEYFTKSTEENANIMKQAGAKILNTANPATQKVILAQMLNQIGYPRLALPILKNVTTNSPEYRDAWIFLGYSYLEMKNYNEAEKALNSALNLDPIHPLTYELLAITYEFKGDNAKAKEYNDKATQLK